MTVCRALAVGAHNVAPEIAGVNHRNPSLDPNITARIVHNYLLCVGMYQYSVQCMESFSYYLFRIVDARRPMGALGDK